MLFRISVRCGYAARRQSPYRCDGEILSYIDVLVDGEFVEELKDITLLFRGSRNQRLICLKEGKDVGRYDELVKR